MSIQRWDSEYIDEYKANHGRLVLYSDHEADKAAAIEEVHKETQKTIAALHAGYRLAGNKSDDEWREVALHNLDTCKKLRAQITRMKAAGDDLCLLSVGWEGEAWTAACADLAGEGGA